MSYNLRHQIFTRLQQSGAEVFYTGGRVRDELTEQPVRDSDVVIFRLSEETIDRILSEFGPLKKYGKIFPVRQVQGLAVEFALPRSSKAVSYERPLEEAMREDALSRDFTVNALYRHTLTGELKDPLGGMKDLKQRLLRMASPNTFSADPLRVYRAFQLASRLNFEIAPETLSTMHDVNVEDVSPERIIQELNKWLLSPSPEIGWQYMKQTGFLPAVFCASVTEKPEALAPRILNHATSLRTHSREPLLLMWSALLAPLILIPIVEGASETQTRMKLQEIMDWYGSLNRNHAHTGQLNGLLTALGSFFRMTSRPSDVRRLCLITDADELKLLICALSPLWKDQGISTAADQALHRFRRWRPEEENLVPGVRGRDLQSLGYPPGKEMGVWLEAAFQMQLEGVEKDKILSFFRKYHNQLRT